ncbi:MAG: SDR family NAD(P)-dependent oxidoreductase, partial [Sphingomonas sp.]
MNDSRLSHEGRVAIVTGAARGIGQAIAVKLAAHGARLVLVDIEEAQETARMIGDESLVATGDVTSAADWARIDTMVQERFGQTDIVVNNAGIGSNKRIDELDFEQWKRTFSINLDSHFLSAKQFVPQMRRNNWGRFVNISSNSIGI